MSDSESVISSSQDNEQSQECEHCDDQSSAYTDDNFDEENTCTIRGKWLYDGSQTIDEMIACLGREIEILTELKQNGWYLVDKVYDDYAILRREVEPEQELTN
jgi:hypothetical protein